MNRSLNYATKAIRRRAMGLICTAVCLTAFVDIAHHDCMRLDRDERDKGGTS